jgi:hypothetical protein
MQKDYGVVKPKKGYPEPERRARGPRIIEFEGCRSRLKAPEQTFVDGGQGTYPK